MKLPLSWLKEYVEITISPEELAEKLVNCGFEVEEIINQSESIINVVTGKIIKTDKHPNADKLTICQVDVGKEILQIITGADNIKTGDIVPVALNNSKLPDGKIIKNGVLRGIDSFGMLCSGSELGLTEDDYAGAEAHGILILDNNLPSGTDINKVLNTDDIIFDISVTANRPDCQSILGLAREVAAVLKKPLKLPDFEFKTTVDNQNLSVKIKATDKCLRYNARLVEDIKIEKSPEWMRKRLKAVGIRPINNIVDITNYVLTEIGQPMHAFDADMVENHSIVVRNACDNEKIIALNDKEYTLNESILTICDDIKPLCIAGVMGGINSGITNKTTSIIFESARFARDNIRRTSKLLGLRSDSSARFEKGVDNFTVEFGLKRALSLIEKLNCGKITSAACDVCVNDIHSKTIKVNPKKITVLLGIKIAIDDILRILNSLSIPSKLINNEIISDIPLFREDIEGAADLAEEVIRFYGYDHIKPTLLKKGNQTRGGKSYIQNKENLLKIFLADNGFNETLTYSFINENLFDKILLPEKSLLRKVLKIKNPLSDDVAVMRTLLFPSLLKTASLNIRKSNKILNLFEIGKVYIPSDKEDSQPKEITHLALLQTGSKADFFTLKTITEKIAFYFNKEFKYKPAGETYLHPGRSAYIYCENKVIGFLGEVHPDVTENFDIDQKIYIAEINLDLIYKSKIKEKTFIPIPKYQSVDRDIALVVKDNISAGDLLDYIKNTLGNICEEIEIFDIYKGSQVQKGYKSIALSIKLRSMDKTMTEEDITNIMQSLLNKLKNKYSAVLR